MTTTALVPVIGHTVCIEPTAVLPERELREITARYILKGLHSTSPEDVAAAQEAVWHRIERAEDYGLTPRDVVTSLLRPALSPWGHCRCPSCKKRCFLCGVAK
ncbi:MAG: hypothetical protein HYX93_05625 [Chloroflexi bacterium]|nr:hypothetical protein [Chloroflexota bacterium]